MHALLLAVALAVPGAWAATGADSLIRRPLTLSLFPPVTTSAPDPGRVATNFAVNLLTGLNGSLRGFEVGTILNGDLHDSYGVQVAGGSNSASGDFTGLQAAFLGNLVGGTARGCQAACVANLNTGRLYGLQGAVVVNASFGGVTGLQFSLYGANVAMQRDVGAQASWANLAVGGITGAQVAVLGNVAGSGVTGAQASFLCNIAAGAITGAQVGFLNLGGDVTGAQVGFVNGAAHVRGVQLGVVNVSTDMSGVPIGFLNVVAHGQTHVVGWVDEAGLLTLGLETGPRAFYNLFTLGRYPRASSSCLVYGYGIGSAVDMPPFSVGADASVSGVSGGPNEPAGVLWRLRLIYGWRVLPKLSLQAGPTWNIHVHRDPDQRLPRPLPSVPLFERTGNGARIDGWMGFSLGIQVL